MGRGDIIYLKYAILKIYNIEKRAWGNLSSHPPLV